ncbi:Uncharacterised protein [Raoultella ornithinolytica]|nr:Uncharacterised protein [Raoultella ornithinolytica]
MKLTPNFYRDRVCLNVLAGSKDNARGDLRGGGRSRSGWRALQKLPGRGERGGGYA